MFINKKYEMLLFSFLMSTFMSGLMSLIISFTNLGFVDGFVLKWLNAYWQAFVIAFPTIFLVVPYVRKCTQFLIKR